MPRPLAAILILALLVARTTHAQSPNVGNQLRIPESVRQEHMVHVSPHLIVFDSTTKSATVELSNIGNTPTDAEIVTQLGFTAWQDRDTALFTPRWDHERAHDTVIVNPTSKDHYAGPWLSGLPTRITLKPHETQHFTLRITPPADLPNGEYYARIVTIVHPKFNRPGGSTSQDTRTMYRVPVLGQIPPPIRDSARVFYRQGPQTMGLRILKAEAQIDTSRAAENAGVGPDPLRILLQVHLTGTAHFEGFIAVYYISEIGEVIPLTAQNGAAFTLHADGVMRWSGQTEGLESGNYVAIIRFIENQDEFPSSQQIPMQPVEVKIPFVLP